MLVIVLSGLYLTNAVAPEYLNALALPYGQAIPMIHQGYENAELQLRLNAMIFIYIVIALGYIAAIFYLFQKKQKCVSRRFAQRFARYSLICYCDDNSRLIVIISFNQSFFDKMMQTPYRRG